MRKEIAGRFDFKNSKTTVDSDGKTITILADDELKLKNVIDMLQSKASKRGISLKAFEYGKVEPAVTASRPASDHREKRHPQRQE